MCKNQSYLNACLDAAYKSHMSYTLGAVLVKGGKILSSGYNHHSSRHNGCAETTKSSLSLSIHAEMHAISNALGNHSGHRDRSPADKTLVRPCPRRVLPSAFENPKPRVLRDPKSGRKLRTHAGLETRGSSQSTRVASAEKRVLSGDSEMEGEERRFVWHSPPSHPP
ncbi:hypothetical protein FRB93_006313 [Tulasnella sp. JGI-2019a]|nr:hypothetical protein FRB93_006313 [Tulasnella sp. JGI-2019a]